jgi:tungstate transport system substrate-binding protein
MTMRAPIALFALAGLSACPPAKDAAVLRVGADRSLEAVGLPAFLRAAFEEASRTRIELVHLDTEALELALARGQLDAAFVVSARTRERLAAEGLSTRDEVLAHEELVLVGPPEDPLGRHGQVSGAELVRNVARTQVRYLKGRRGSVERAAHDALFLATGDRAEPGSFFDTEHEGRALVDAVRAAKGFGLVKRSSLMQAALEDRFPHRVYREGDPGLVLRVALVVAHPARTGRAPSPAFVDFALGEPGRKITARFGLERFGVPVYAPGEPPEGEGARVPGLEALREALGAPRTGGAER